MLFFGVDLAWSEGRPGRAANETGLAVIDETGLVVDAGWARGLDQVEDWLATRLGPGSVIAIDAPLVVHNPVKTMRECEREVGRRYGRWGFSAYPSHPGLAWLAGVGLRERLEQAGVSYTDGTVTSSYDEMVMFECYPNTTIVGMPELGYAGSRPRYKGRIRGLSAAASREARAASCDELISRLSRQGDALPPIELASHPTTAALVDSPSPLADGPFKHREDLLDACLSAWTASVWHRHGESRTQVLGLGSPPDPEGRVATIVAPARPEQRQVAPGSAEHSRNQPG